ncbi:hypothetical protein HPB48_007050 [Haemaphysalis longicornis]|uniref:Peptidase M13 N-terminal domain-containing protein n=1 Tax=Haemaphysalis longicornis TaxID=44386 RepID=A0A9J6GQ04_HAELO|nr:hypothetical protein HPB48_007050 [Haemaphysalis longicornis]
MVSKLYTRKTLPRKEFPWPSPARYYGNRDDVERSGNILFNSPMQPHSAFFQPPGLASRHFFTPEGAEIVVSLHGAQKPALQLEEHGLSTETPNVVQGACFSNFAGIHASPANAGFVIRNTSIQGPSGRSRSLTTAVAPKTSNVLQLEPMAMRVAAPEAMRPLTAMQTNQKEGRRFTPVATKRRSSSRSVDIVPFLSDSEERSSLRSNPSMTSSMETVLTRAGESGEQTAVSSTDKIILTGRRRLHSDLANKIYQPSSTVLYGVLLVGTLASIMAGSIGYFGHYAAPSLLFDITESEYDITPHQAAPWVQSPTAKRASSLSTKKECRNPWCSEQLAALIHSFNDTVRPCQDFYSHVCAQSQVGNATPKNQVAQPVEQRVVGFFQGTHKPGREEQVLGASRQLWKDCVDLATLKQLGNAPFQDLLKRTGLGGWPYNREDALPDVWEVAGKLQRRMELAPLVEVKARIGNTLKLSPGNWNCTVDSEDVLGAMLTIRTDILRHRQLAEDVAAFSYKMNALLYSHEPLMSHHQASDANLVLRPFLQVALDGLIPYVGIVGPELGNFIYPLVQLVRETRPETVLNLLGYRLLRHVDLFTLPVVKSDLKSAQNSSR